MKYVLVVLALLVMLYAGIRCFIDFSHSGKQDFTALGLGVSFCFAGILGLLACYQVYLSNQK